MEKIYGIRESHDEAADAVAIVFADAGFDFSTATVDVSSRASVEALVATATAIGPITDVIHAAEFHPRRRYPRRSSMYIFTAPR